MPRNRPSSASPAEWGKAVGASTTAEAESGSSRQRSMSPIGSRRARRSRSATTNSAKSTAKGNDPERVELLPHPLDGRGVVVLPDQLVVEPERAGRLVGAAEERRAPAVGQGDNAGLPVDQAEDLVGQHPDRELARAQAVVEPPEAGLGPIAERLRPRFAPLAPHGRLRRLRHLDVGARQVRVADDADAALHLLERLPGDFEDGRRELAGDAIVAPGPRPDGASGSPRRAAGDGTSGVGASRRSHGAAGGRRKKAW